MLVVANAKAAREDDHRYGHESPTGTDTDGHYVPRHEQHEHHEAHAADGPRPLGRPPARAEVVRHGRETRDYDQSDHVRHVLMVGNPERRLKGARVPIGSYAFASSATATSMFTNQPWRGGSVSPLSQGSAVDLASTTTDPGTA
jgi:hypothetical protein